MLRLRLLCVGKPRNRDMAALHESYSARIVRLGVKYEASWVPEVVPRSRLSDDHLRRRNGLALHDALEAGGTVIALDPAGRLLTSEDLASKLSSWANTRATFVVGGPDGLHRLMLERADWTWSLSRLTFPHELVRVLVAEQLYRALMIVRGLPYHK